METLIISSDPEVHAERIREVEKLGATTMNLMNVSGAEPQKAIEVYGGRVLPALAKISHALEGPTAGAGW